MATKRLTQWDKEQLSSNVEKLLAKLKHATDDPLKTEADVIQFIRGFSSKEQLEAYDRLVSLAPDAVVVGSSYTAILVGPNKPTTVRALVRHRNFGVPKLSSGPLTLHEGHPQYAAAAQYVGELRVAKEDIERTQATAWFVISRSSSAAQLNRALPFLAGYLPTDAGKSLADAKRLSRLNSEVTEFLRTEPEKVEELHNKLALASLISVPDDLQDMWGAKFIGIELG